MNHDDFEAQLRKQTPRTIPPEWRREILSAAGGAARSGRNEREAANASLGWAWVREWLWPSPKAWAGVAAVWAIILALQLPDRERLPAQVAERPAQAGAAEMAHSMQAQQLLRAELREESVSSDRKPIHLGPRSDQRGERASA